MARNDAEIEASTRRRYLQYGAVVIGGGLLAGCQGGGVSSGSNSSNGSSATDTEKVTESTGTTTSAIPYEITIKPNSTHTFEQVPQTYGVITGSYLDMGMALGIQPSATTGLERAPLKYYELLENVTFDKSKITKLASDAESGYDKENFYAADCDVWLIDPRTLKNFANLNDSDLKGIESQTGPFLGSNIRFGRKASVGQQTYYTLYEAFEKVAKVFQRQQQFAAWQSFHDEFMSTIQDDLPSEDKRPTVAAIWRGVRPDSGEFRIAPLGKYANNTKSFWRVGMKDAFAGNYPDGTIGYEELINVDPDYIGAVGGLTSDSQKEFTNGVVKPFKNNPNAQSLTAVQEGNIIRSGGQFMGPIVDMFSTEAVAKMVYPDTFGEWPGPVGELSKDQQMFDRKRLSNITNGNL